MTVRLGLTGGIASGKSSVAAIFSQLGACVIDADAISRIATSGEGKAIPRIQTTFGPEFIDNTGALDRARMRDLVFRDPTARRKLEEIVHPLVGQEIFLQAQQAQSAGAPCIVFDIPLLVESSHWRPQLDKVLIVDCSSETQRTRVAARDKLPDNAIDGILRAQTTRTTRLRAADTVLFNDGGINLHQLEAMVQQLAPQFGL